MSEQRKDATPAGSDSPGHEKGVFDISALDSITRHHPAQRAALLQLVSGLVASSADELAQARALCGEGDTEPALKILHTLRGAVGTLGAKRFADATIVLEKALRQGSSETAVHFDSAIAELKRTLTMAQSWLKE
ncbi:MAG: Hpt domain-containing protein [Pseudomonadota bacterium]